MADRDPRLYQIVALAGLLSYGLVSGVLDVTAARGLLLIGTCTATQWFWTKRLSLPRFDPRSAVITGLSLSLLLRSGSLLLLGLGAILAISSKFVLVLHKQHIFNPACIAIVILLVCSNNVWVSPGQWGTVAWFGLLMGCAGTVVTSRARRLDVSLAFLVTYGGLLLLRSLYLGEPAAIPLHRMQSGALLLFAFFMISDPRTTPAGSGMRVFFAMLVAAGAFYVQFRMFRTNGLFWSLALISPLVPMFDRIQGKWMSRLRHPPAPIDESRMLTDAIVA